MHLMPALALVSVVIIGERLSNCRLDDDRHIALVTAGPAHLCYPVGLRALACPRSTAYVDNADVGFGDTCILTVASDRIALPSGERVTLPDHGYAWFQRLGSVTSEVRGTRRDPELATTWSIEEPPFL